MTATTGDRMTILDEIGSHVPEHRIVTDPDVMLGLSKDQGEGAPAGKPIAVIRAESTEEVAEVVRACIRYRVPLVTRGAGTGLSGGANAIDGGIVIALDRMNQVLRVDPMERLAVVQAGVVNDDLRRIVADYGLWYPPDPASSPWSTIGGNVATNAGGICCVKYGVTRDYVLALEMVTGTGEIVRIGHRTAKGVAGYDLVGLVVGAEGTLGVVTEVTVRLRPLPPPARSIVGFFGSIIDAGNAVRAVADAGLTPSALELIDRHCLAAVDAWKNMGLSVDAEVILLARVDDPGGAGDAQAAAMVECFTTSGATFAAASRDDAEADAMFAARRLAYPALERLGPVVTEDVCVPKAQVPEMLTRIEAAAERHGVKIANVAHAGDGNLHPLLIAQTGDDDERHRTELAFDEIVADAIALGGTVTGEHGVGLLKRRGLSEELSPAVMEMHRAVKQALDPHIILNPGKIFDPS
jgi:glycolate oxidase